MTRQRPWVFLKEARLYPRQDKDATISVAAERAYHPIMQYLDALPDWDGIQRADTLLVDLFRRRMKIHKSR